MARFRSNVLLESSTTRPAVEPPEGGEPWRPPRVEPLGARAASDRKRASLTDGGSKSDYQATTLSCHPLPCWLHLYTIVALPIWKCEKVCGHYQFCSVDRAWVFSLWNRSPLLFVSVFYINNDGSRTRVVLPLCYTPIIFWLPALGCTKAGMCDLRRIAQIIGAIPRETAGSFQEVPLNSRITPWVFNKRSNLTFICVRSFHLLRFPLPAPSLIWHRRDLITRAASRISDMQRLLNNNG